MKKPQIFSLFICFSLLAVPLQSYAQEGFSWETITETDSSEDEDEDSEDSDDDEENRSRDSDDDEEDDRSRDSDDDEEDDRSRDSDEDEEDDEDTGDSDADTQGSRLKSAPSGASYPSGNIYSKSETADKIHAKYKELEKAYAIEDAFKRTKTIDSIDSFILNFSGDPLKGKKLAFLGDSITAGNGGTLTPDGSGMNYTDFIANYTSAQIVNLGLGGTPIEGKDNNDAIVYRYRDIPKDSDIIVLFGGINDLFEGQDSFGSLEHSKKGTYCTDTQETFQMIHKRYPDADVYVVITYPNKMEDYKEYTGESWQKYADVQIELAEKYDFQVINLYQEGFMDSKDSRVRNAFFKDDIHPDDLGSEVLGRHILVHLLRKYVS